MSTAAVACKLEVQSLTQHDKTAIPKPLSSCRPHILSSGTNPEHSRHHYERNTHSSKRTHHIYHPALQRVASSLCRPAPAPSMWLNASTRSTHSYHRNAILFENFKHTHTHTHTHTQDTFAQSVGSRRPLVINPDSTPEKTTPNNTFPSRIRIFPPAQSHHMQAHWQRLIHIRVRNEDPLTSLQSTLTCNRPPKTQTQ
jgi:hypothetical protein